MKGEKSQWIEKFDGSVADPLIPTERANKKRRPRKAAFFYLVGTTGFEPYLRV
jgi:hypothetical protein